jgi:hypothetical protein
VRRKKVPMRLFFILAPLILIQPPFHAQTAEEILSDLKTTYKGAANYVDQGTYTKYIKREGKMEREVSGTSFYHVAMDTSQNAFHWIKSSDTFDGQRASSGQRIIGWEYRKSADQEEGTFIRSFETRDTPETRTLAMACASLYAVGGGILDMTAGLMFPYLYDSTAYFAGMFVYDSVMRVNDATINGRKCYVIERFASYFKTQEMIDFHERRRDSIQSLHPMPFPYPKNKQEPGVIKLKNRYYVRISDGLIVRMERFQFGKDDYEITCGIEMDPRVNVPEFEKYLSY